MILYCDVSGLMILPNEMKRFFPCSRQVRPLLLVPLIGALFWSGVAPSVLAQHTRTLDIRDGTVYVDGTPLSEDELPNDLNLDGVNARYRFVGIQRPVVELNGRLFAVGDSLTPVTGDEVRGAKTSVVMQGQTARAGAASAPGGEQSAQADYLSEMQQSSRELYQRLQRERELEQEAENLARAVRGLEEGEGRRSKVDSLRSMLNTLFELKQENHRREIQQLQRKIQELQRRHQKREQMREAMIDHRLQQLLGSVQRR